MSVPSPQFYCPICHQRVEEIAFHPTLAGIVLLRCPQGHTLMSSPRPGVPRRLARMLGQPHPIVLWFRRRWRGIRAKAALFEARVWYRFLLRKRG